MRKKLLVMEVRSLLHLSILARIVHPKARKVIKVYSAAIVMTMGGVTIARAKHELSEFTHISALIFDAIGYMIHGAGIVPIVHYAEAFFTLIAGEMKEN